MDQVGYPVKRFISDYDGCKFDYFIAPNPHTGKPILSYRIIGGSNRWLDFEPNNAAYGKYERKEFESLLKEAE